MAPHYQSIKEEEQTLSPVDTNNQQIIEKPFLLTLYCIWEIKQYFNTIMPPNQKLAYENEDTELVSSYEKKGTCLDFIRVMFVNVCHSKKSIPPPWISKVIASHIIRGHVRIFQVIELRPCFGSMANVFLLRWHPRLVQTKPFSAFCVRLWDWLDPS